MSINLAIGPVVSLIAGVLILIVPRLLNFIVAIYLIIIGLIGVFGWSGTHLRTTGIDTEQIPASRVVAAAMAVPRVIDTGAVGVKGSI